jgi:hypothetical protein
VRTGYNVANTGEQQGYDQIRSFNKLAHKKEFDVWMNFRVQAIKRTVTI